MTTRDIPDFLTLEEAARILRIGRTTAYLQANLWLDTNGREGMPAIKVGGLIRVPRAQFEEHYSICITMIPDRDARRGPANAKGPGRGRAQDTPRASVTGRRRRAKGDGAQGGLPFVG